VVICTGYSEKITQKLLDRPNIKALILKPIIRNELLISIRQVLDDAKAESSHAPLADDPKSNIRR
jgi:hypothetical protein